MTNLGRRSLLVPALALATVAACDRDGVGPAGPTAVALAAVTDPACLLDATAPVISNLTATPPTLWPPNHKFATIAVSYSVADPNGCTAVADLRQSLTVSSNEPVNGLGDGNTAPDWQVLSLNTVLLRAERSGLGTGRVYTITLTVTDLAGNTSTRSVIVTVPHDQGKRGR